MRRRQPRLPLPPTPHYRLPRLRDRRARLARLEALDRQLSDPELWQDPARGNKLAQEAKSLRDDVESWRRLESRAHDLLGLTEMAIEEEQGEDEASLRA